VQVRLVKYFGFRNKFSGVLSVDRAVGFQRKDPPPIRTFHLSEESFEVRVPCPDEGIGRDIFAQGGGHGLVLQVHVKDPSVVVLKHLGDVEAGGRDPAGVQANSQARVPMLQEILKDSRVSIERSDAMIVNGHADVEFADEFFELIEDLEIGGFNDDELHVHEFGGLEEASVFVAIQGGIGDAERVGTKSAGRESGFLAQELFTRRLGIKVDAQSEVRNAVSGGEFEGLIKVESSKGPSLDAKLGARHWGLGSGKGRRQERRQPTQRECPIVDAAHDGSRRRRGLAPIVNGLRLRSKQIEGGGILERGCPLPLSRCRGPQEGDGF